MPIKRWESGFTSTVYQALYGGSALKRIYYGSQLVFDTGSTFSYINKNPGTTTITIPTRGCYSINLVGAGGGGGNGFMYYSSSYYWFQTASGGSGAWVHGWKELDAGTYTVTIGNPGGGASGYNGQRGGDGTATTAFGETAGGGGGGYADGWIGQSGTPGTAGVASPNLLTGKNGNPGAAAYNQQGIAGGASVYNGHGAGGNGGAAGSQGLLQVTYLSPPKTPLWASDAPGTYTITVPVTALYEVVVVGGGGGGAAAGDGPRDYKACEAGGGSGAAVVGKWKLTAGTYTVVIGAGGSGAGGLYTTVQGGTGGTSSFSNLISCTGGTGGIARWTDQQYGNPTAGTGGSYSATSQQSVSVTSNGNDGGIHTQAGTAVGGASVYNGYGAGGGAYSAGYTADGYTGGNGYVSIRQLSGVEPTTLSVYTNPSDATVNFSSVPADGILARSGNTVTAHVGTQITYTVTKTGYTTYTETLTLNSQTTKNVTMVPRRTITVTSTSNPISEAQYSINNGAWQNLTLNNNVGTITCDDGNTLAVRAKGGNYNEEDKASQGTVYTRTITVAGNSTITFNFAYEAWDDVYYSACRSAPGIGSNLAYIALDPSYLSYTPASNVQYIGIEVWDESMEGVDFPDVDHYHFRIQHGTTFNFSATIPNHSYGTTSEAYPGQYNDVPLNYKAYKTMFMTAVDTVTLTLDDETAAVSDLSTTLYTRSGNTIKVIRGQTLNYTIYKNGHSYSATYVDEVMLPAPKTVNIPITVNDFLGYTITFNINVSGATIVVDSTTLSGNSIYLYKDDTSNHPYTITKTGYNTTTGTITYPTDSYTHTINITMQDLYPSGTVVFQSGTAGTTTWTVPVTKTYEITAVGGGGGTVVAVGGGTTKARACTGAAGGSGGKATGRFALTEGQILTIVIGTHGDDKTDQLYTGSGTNYITCSGGGTSSVTLNGTTLVNATGGGGGYTDNRTNNNYYASPAAGGGGSGSVHSSAISSSTANGNAGTAQHKGWDYSISVTGGASVFGGYGKASSGSAWCPAGVSIDGTGTAGGVKITAV